LGRASFPLFAYAAAIAVLREAPVPPRRYVFRLLVVAALAQPAYYWVLKARQANILFTLALGAVWTTLSLRVTPVVVYAIYTIALLPWWPPLPLDYGLLGILLPSALALALQGHRGSSLFLFLLLVAINTGGWAVLTRENLNQMVILFHVANSLAATLLPLLIIHVAKYMSQIHRLLPKHALYVFYPVHLVALKYLIPYVFK
ncbi:MAG: hypothetical protein HY052_10070, partial [Proteobacteria bacterium]|nr:hypothetical protein [Pseudomonadota bacterium]